jgi:formimidoylglutamate deiminase
MILVPDLLYRDDAFYSGLALEFDENTGRIERVLHQLEIGNAAAMRLPGRALMPGFVNAHSHSFQRLIRGRTQWRPSRYGASDFWSWRSSMYAAVLNMSPDALYDVARFCFLEMLKAGYTTVGEFHYLQRDPSGAAYADPNELGSRIIAAATSVGIRICLLNVCYARGGINEPLQPEQRRFATPDVDAFIRATESLAEAAVGDALTTVGMAPHSLRAVPREWLPSLHDWAAARDVPFHMHVAEQPAEVHACIDAYGMRPMELLSLDGILDDHFTAIHGTHLDDRELRMFGDARASVCLCPTTERDLGDGLARIEDLAAARASLCMGTDSQSVIDPFEELRLIEYHERLRLLRRVVLSRPHAREQRHETPPFLLSIGTIGGANALRLSAGAFESGMVADFVAIDLEHPSLVGWQLDSLAALVTMSAPCSVVRDVWVSGIQRVTEGHHDAEHEIHTAYRAAAEQNR